MGTMNELAVMGVEGDVKTIWDPDKPDEVEAARAQFNSLKKKGYSIFHVKKDGEAGKRMDEFDPNAEKMVAVPRVVGG